MSKPPVKALAEFSEVLLIIRSGRAKAFEAVNLALMETYWTVGAYLSRKVGEAGWGKSVVLQLASWLQVHAPEAKGFSAQNLWRMKQFYEVFSADKILSVVPRVLSWRQLQPLCRAALDARRQISRWCGAARTGGDADSPRGSTHVHRRYCMVRA